MQYLKTAIKCPLNLTVGLLPKGVLRISVGGRSFAIIFSAERSRAFFADFLVSDLPLNDGFFQKYHFYKFRP